MQDSETREVPQDLLIEIAARLPAKSLMRFKCISKFWSSLPLSRHFCNRFLMYQSQPQPRLYMSLVYHMDFSKSLLLSSTPTPATFPSSLEFHQDLTIREMGSFLLCIVRGFICFNLNLEACIYNPSTRQLVILPAVKESFLTMLPRYFTHYFIGHEPVGDQYKILCVITGLPCKEELDEEEKIPESMTEHWVFALEAGGSWKRVAMDFHTHYPSPIQVTMNGSLYYVTWNDLDTSDLVSFNIRSEELSMIQVPRKAGDVLPRLDKHLSLINYGGKVAVFDNSFIKDKGMVDLWVVEDWRNKEWSRKTLFLQPSQMHLVPHNRFRVKGTTQGQVIFVPICLISPFYFLWYDLEINHLEKVEINGIPDHWFSMHIFHKSFDVEFMDPTENVKYLET